MTLFDQGGHNIIPAYYLIKLGTLALLFLKPFQQAKRLSDLLRNYVAQQVQEAEKQQRSPVVVANFGIKNNCFLG